MTTIYIVTSGSYSDYSINEVFANKADAERYAATVAYDEGHVEEYELRESLPAEQRTLHQMSTGITADGARNAHEIQYDVFPGIGGTPKNDRPKVTIERGPHGDRPTWISVRVAGYDLTMVRQAFSDAVAGETARLELA